MASLVAPPTAIKMSRARTTARDGCNSLQATDSSAWQTSGLSSISHAGRAMHASITHDAPRSHNFETNFGLWVLGVAPLDRRLNHVGLSSPLAKHVTGLDAHADTDVLTGAQSAIEHDLAVTCEFIRACVHAAVVVVRTATVPHAVTATPIHRGLRFAHTEYRMALKRAIAEHRVEAIDAGSARLTRPNCRRSVLRWVEALIVTSVVRVAASQSQHQQHRHPSHD